MTDILCPPGSAPSADGTACDPVPSGGVPVWLAVALPAAAALGVVYWTRSGHRAGGGALPGVCRSCHRPLGTGRGLPGPSGTLCERCWREEMAEQGVGRAEVERELRRKDESRRAGGGGMDEEFGRQFGPPRRVTIQLSHKGASILKMLQPYPWEADRDLRGEWNGNRVTVDRHQIERLVIQSGPGVGFPIGDRKRIVAAAARLGIRPDDRGRFRSEQFA